MNQKSLIQCIRTGEGRASRDGASRQPSCSTLTSSLWPGWWGMFPAAVRCSRTPPGRPCCSSSPADRRCSRRTVNTNKTDVYLNTSFYGGTENRTFIMDANVGSSLCWNWKWRHVWPRLNWGELHTGARGEGAIVTGWNIGTPMQCLPSYLAAGFSVVCWSFCAGLQTVQLKRRKRKQE